MLYENIKKLVQYGIETGLTPACEKNYTTNLLLDLFKEDDYVEPEEEYTDIDLEEVLKGLLDEAVSRGIIEDSVVYRDLFDTKIMNCLMPRPAQLPLSNTPPQFYRLLSACDFPDVSDTEILLPHCHLLFPL